MPRYIDAEKIKYTKFVPENDTFDGAGGLCALKSHIDAIPTADVQEVRHAKFELVNNGKGVCRNCHRLDSIDKLAKYCRYCGARMDGDEK